MREGKGSLGKTTSGRDMGEERHRRMEESRLEAKQWKAGKKLGGQCWEGLAGVVVEEWG